jgi:mannose-1-phosphate guanylyltransferase
MMRAILLAAGFGKRLRPLTDKIPKCLVPINGEPLLGIWLVRLTEAGIGPFLINTHYLSEQVEEFVEESEFGDQIELFNEPALLGTAGTLSANIDFYKGEEGLLIHADNYCQADFNDFIEAHKKRPPGCVMTMMTFRTDTTSLCGIVELDEHDVVIGFHEKVINPPGNLANGAVYILGTEALEIIDKELNSAKEFSTEVLSHFIGRIYTYEVTDVFLDIGTPNNYLKVVGDKQLL